MLEHLRLLTALMRGQRLRYAAAIGAIVAATAVSFLVPLVSRAALDGAIARAGDLAGTGGPEAGAAATASAAGEGPVLALLGGASFLAGHLWVAGLAMVALTAVSGGFTYLRGRWSAVACESIARRLRDRLHDHLQHLPARYHDKADTGDLVQRCTSDVETIRLFLSQQVVEIGHALVLLLAVIPIMLWLSPEMTAASLLLVPVIVGFGVVFFILVKRRFLEADEAEGRMTKVLQENLTGIRVVRAFARQAFERAKFAGPSADYRDRSFRMSRLMAVYWGCSDFLSVSQMGLALAAGAYLVASGRLSVGTLYAFQAYLILMLWPVRQMGRTLTDLGKAVVSLGRVEEVLRQPREDDRAPAAEDAAPAFRGGLEIEGLTFAHAPGAPPALRDVSLSVAPGETVALIGPSGAGKSTLVHLLLRLYDYEQGSIRLDGHELRDLGRKPVRRQIGAVLQEPFLFSKSLLDNIRLGRSHAGEDDVAAAAEAASIHATIRGFERGYDTRLGERGVNLSGGQRQRVALARALVRDPVVLVLDDALSAVDSRTERVILRALARRHGRRTTLLIAHRLSTLRHADRVVVLEAGRVTQTGTHDELVNRDGFYRRLWLLQGELERDLQRELVGAVP